MARRLCAAALGVCATLLACATGTALATAVNAADRERLDRTARYLQDAQNADGGFSVRVGGPSEPGASAWVALGLAAAGVNPQEQTPLSGGHSVYTYLQEHAQALSSTTAFARELLVVDAAGAAPEDFGGVHLVEEILSRQLEGPGSTGAFAEEAHSSAPSVNGTIFAILALSPIDEERAAKAVQQAAQWLLTVHNAGAGWPSHEVCPSHASPGGCESNTDMTGAAIEALNAAGLERQPVQEEAFEYLRQYAQSPNGGFSQQAEEAEPNVASTAWVLQGIWSAAENPEAWPWLTEAAGDPMSYLASMQQEDGHIRYDASEEDNGVWMTAQVAPAYAGQPFPIPAVPLKAEPNQPPASSDSAAPGPAGAEAGDGGESAYPGPGVISAGGGDGASLFSRPQPQSQGRTPDGVRLLDAGRARAARRARAKAVRGTEAAVAPTAAGASVTITAAPAKAGPDRHDTGSGTQGRASGAGSEGGQQVRGELIKASPTAQGQPLEPGAPGLRGAGAGRTQTPWLAIAIGILIGLLILAGAQLERRRPRVIL